MPRFAVIFRDKPAAETGWIRKEHDQAHFDYLAAHADRIVIAGGLRPDMDRFWCGGLWVIEAGDREECIGLIEGDPYFRFGLRASYELFVWGKAPNYGPVTL